MGPCTAHANASTTVGPMYMGNEAAGSMYFGPVGNHSAAGSCTKHSSEYVGYMSAIVVATGTETHRVARHGTARCLALACLHPACP